MDCTQISQECPVESSIYGYYPDLAANAFFAAFFGVFMIINLFLGIRYRAWTFLIAMTFGCGTESLGYVGRILLNDNPFGMAGFNMQICCLTLAPAFIAAGIYLTLKHIVICFGEEHSYLKPKYYTWLFIGFDLFSLTLQGAGGGIAATADTNRSLQNVGNNLMMAGISFQVVTLFAFGAMAAVYYVRPSRSGVSLSASAQRVRNSTGFKLFLGGFLFAFVTIFIRCVYRIAEMAGGWRNPIMQNETEFIVLDSVYVPSSPNFIAVSLTVIAE
jgi:RTA1 like protein